MGVLGCGGGPRKDSQRMVVAAGSTSWLMNMSRSKLGSSKSKFRNLSTSVWQLRGERMVRLMGGWLTESLSRGKRLRHRKPRILNILGFPK